MGWVGVGVSFGRIVRLVGPEYSEDGFHGRFLLVVLLQLLLVVGVEASTRLLGYFVKSNLFVVLRWLFHTCMDGLMNLQICTLSKSSATDKALVRLFTSMDAFVDLHVVLESEALVADVALVGPLALVDY